MTIGNKIKLLRTNKGITQEQLAELLHISGQAVSKWENETSNPDIAMLPALAELFGITIDELFDYKLNALTDKEKFIKFMAGTGTLSLGEYQLKSGMKSSYYIDTEKFVTNAQISKIGEYFADCIRENNIEADAIVGLAYHGIAFSVAIACALFEKYGITMNYCHDRQMPDKRGREICGYTLKDGDRVIIVDDLLASGKSIEERIERMRKIADITVEAVVVIANHYEENTACIGKTLLEEKYGAKVYSVITHDDIQKAVEKHYI
ncbi:MAG: helix-turn-helix domain-containing protein [Lachnospiraceae bacterium]|nr:helix-turn-helix domain-containing protein [Lachnospiraceae bacterium]